MDLDPKTFYIIQLMLEPDAEGTAPSTGWYGNDDVNYWYLADEMEDAERFDRHYEALATIDKLVANGTKIKTYKVHAAREREVFSLEMYLV